MQYGLDCAVKLSRRIVSNAHSPLLPRRRLCLVSRGWERSKFFKNATVYESKDKYGVQLDHRRLHTPLRKLVELPSRALALAVAQEWNSQERHIQPSAMHLTALCNTVIDNIHSSRVAVVTELLNYLPTDTLLYRQVEPDDLNTMESVQWDPVISWFNERFSMQLQPTTQLSLPTIPQDSLNIISSFINNLNAWSFAGFRYGIESTKSLILTAALFDGHLDVETACALSQLEARYQEEKWGSVEWHHNLEREDLSSRLAASFLLAELVSMPS